MYTNVLRSSSLPNVRDRTQLGGQIKATVQTRREPEKPAKILETFKVPMVTTTLSDSVRYYTPFISNGLFGRLPQEAVAVDVIKKELNVSHLNIGW